MVLWSVQSRSRVYMGQNCKSNYKETGKAKQIVQPFLPLHLAAPINSGLPRGPLEVKLNKLWTVAVRRGYSHRPCLRLFACRSHKFSYLFCRFFPQCFFFFSYVCLRGIRTCGCEFRAGDQVKKGSALEQLWVTSSWADRCSGRWTAGI